jgi:hypothetical protein
MNEHVKVLEQMRKRAADWGETERTAALDAAIAALKAEAWQATDAVIREWVERHWLGCMSVTDARCVFEDARAAHLAAQESANG